jgi:hypothetical protein
MPKNVYKPKPDQKKGGIFTYVEKKVPLSQLFIDGLPTRYLPIIFYGFLLGIIYVGNTHYYERTARQAENLEQEIETLRVEFISLKSAYMLASKQSTVAKRVAPLGIVESNEPPFKIKLNKNK